MYLHTLSTGSVGNCYILNASSGERLIIELGVNIKEIKKALNFDLNSVEGCLVSHSHLDHAKEINTAMQSGLKVYSNTETFQKTGLSIKSEFQNEINDFSGVLKLNNFSFFYFWLNHDVDCNGYLINHEESGIILFATDTFMIKQQFNFPINHFIIEANYCEEILNDKERLGIGNTYVSDRVRRSHLSIQNCIKFLKRHDLSECMNIILIHLSDSNSDEKRFVEMVKKEFPFVEVTAARKDQIVNLNKNPF